MVHYYFYKTNFYIMDAWHIWAIVALLLVVGEIFTAGFALICIAIGAAAAAVGAYCGLVIEGQLICLAVGSLVALLAVRPILRRVSKVDATPTNADALIGRKARVVEDIEANGGTGRVALDGDQWQAVSENNEAITKGETVVVVGRESIILTVKKQ